MPTDRLLVEWHLDSKRVIAAINDLTPEPRECPAAHVHLPLAVAQGESSSPAAFSSFTPAPRSESTRGAGVSPASAPQAAPAPSQTPDISSLIEIQSRIRAEFTDWFSRGYAVLGVRSTLSGVDYCLAPYSDF
jgi:predicted GNAT superfamily acetyltransferase